MAQLEWSTLLNTPPWIALSESQANQLIHAVMNLCRIGVARHLGPLRGRQGTTPEICNDYFPEREKAAAANAFKTFCTQTLNGLIDLEESRTGQPSDLRIFCRMDVSVIRHQSGRFRYFVSEVERSQTVALYRGLAYSDAGSMLLDAVSAITRKYKFNAES